MTAHAVLEYSRGTMNIHMLLPPPVAIRMNVSHAVSVQLHQAGHSEM